MISLSLSGFLDPHDSDICPLHLNLEGWGHDEITWFAADQSKWTASRVSTCPQTPSIDSVNTKHLCNICTMLDQRRRRWADVVQMLYKCFVFVEDPVLNYCWTDVADGGPTLTQYWVNWSRFLGIEAMQWQKQCIAIPDPLHWTDVSCFLGYVFRHVLTL